MGSAEPAGLQAALRATQNAPALIGKSIEHRKSRPSPSVLRASSAAHGCRACGRAIGARGSTGSAAIVRRASHDSSARAEPFARDKRCDAALALKVRDNSEEDIMKRTPLRIEP